MGIAPMAAISLQPLFYFKNNGLMKKVTLKKHLQTRKRRKPSSHENLPASLPIPAKPPPPFLASFPPPLTRADAAVGGISRSVLWFLLSF
jgi:hypothetical protein